MLPDNRNEIPRPEAACNHSHLQDIASDIPDVDPDAKILLLIGRDVIQAHKVLDQRNGPPNAPFAQKLALGWVIIGNICLGGAHKPVQASVFKMNILDNGHPSHFLPCKNFIQVKEHIIPQSHNKVSLPNYTKYTSIGETVFQQTSLDERPGYSQEEVAFLQIMNKEVYQDNTNSWVAPLPFRSPRPRLSNNKQQAIQRLASVRHMLNKRPQHEKSLLGIHANPF